MKLKTEEEEARETCHAHVRSNRPPPFSTSFSMCQRFHFLMVQSPIRPRHVLPPIPPIPPKLALQKKKNPALHQTFSNQKPPVGNVQRFRSKQVEEEKEETGNELTSNLM